GGRPFRGDQLGALWRAAVDQDHVGMLVVNLVQTIPDQAVVVEVEAASECDLRPRWQHDLGFSAALGSDEVPRLDHCRGQRARVTQRSGWGAPGRAGVKLKTLDGLIAEELQAVASFDQCDAFGRQALELDRSHFGAILLALALALRLFVVV